MPRTPTTKIGVANNYRSDIDGLRAIAVLAVVLFHVDSHRLRGGFIGVDVFFVISGFLISGHILSAIENGSFSFLDFYVRRINRIFPALLVVLTAVLLFGWFALFDDELKQLAEAAVSGLLFYPNILLFSQTGYFDSASELKPLLHLWSLGVEEQFYFLWPVLLLFLRKKVSAKALILSAGGMSFVLSLFLVYQKPEAAFYLPFGRFWELLAGAFLAAQNRVPNSVPTAGPLSRDRRSVAGFLLILLSLFVISRRLTYFPGIWACLPVMGASLIISAGPNGLINRRVLAHPWAVFIGLLSYPLYLWHWPLLYSANVLSRGAPTLLLKVIAVAIAAILSYLTYKLIELPIRRLPQSKKPGAAMWLVLVSGLVLGASLFTFTRGNAKFRGDGFALGADLGSTTMEECGLTPKQKADATWCMRDRKGSANAVIFGDSNAHATFPGLLKLAPSGQHWSLLANAGCGPFLGVRFTDPDMPKQDREKCERFIEAAVGTIAGDSTIKIVVLAMKRTIENDKSYELKDLGSDAPVKVGLRNTIKTLQAAGKSVVLLVHNPDVTGTPDFCAARPVELSILRRLPTCSIPRTEYERQTAHMRELFASLQSQFPDVRIFDPVDQLCDQNECSVFSSGESLYSYTTHLSDSGNKRVAGAFFSWLPTGNRTNRIPLR